MCIMILRSSMFGGTEDNMDEERKRLYEEIERQRNSKLIVYVTGDRKGLETQIANDATDCFIEHLDSIGVVPKISLLLDTNGGNTLAEWNIVNLIRQFCDDFEVIVPLKAKSTGTLMCLGANRIIMTKQATLGPIDPSVNTALNPAIPNAGPDARVPVSVEAIKGYFELAKHELKIKDDGALAQIFSDLSSKVHPLVLGEVYRAIGQIRMLAEKLLKNQVTDPDKAEKIISFLCSESGSHDYTINRREAKDNLGLNIEKPTQEFYNVIRDTYNSIKSELELNVPYSPQLILANNNNRATGYNFKRVIIESLSGGTDCFVSEGIVSTVNVSLPNGTTQTGINDKRTFEGWKHYDQCEQ